jgi:hypothetical protein
MLGCMYHLWIISISRNSLVKEVLGTTNAMMIVSFRIKESLNESSLTILGQAATAGMYLLTRLYTPPSSPPPYCPNEKISLVVTSRTYLVPYFPHWPMCIMFHVLRQTFFYWSFFANKLDVVTGDRGILSVFQEQKQRDW